MKFANIIMTREGRCTIGDDIQLLAIENLYNYMGIDYKEVVRIPFNQLSTYDGEYVVLPISFPLYGYSHDTAITQYSDKIIPVFLGMAILTNTLSENEVVYLKKFQPIGCRDQYTMDVLRRYGIVSYLNGCMTATLPRRKPLYSEKYNKIFCVDVPDSLKDMIPKEVLDDCIFCNHVYLTSECPDGTEAKAKEIYNRYKDEAKLIITTRLHAALPCAAMGIPVVLAKNQLSYRFAILSKLMHIYSYDEFKEIDWNPEPIDFEEHKQKILSFASKRVTETYNQYSSMFEISEFYEGDTTKTTYFEAISDAILFIDSNYNKEDNFDYCLWAITQTAEVIYQYITENYKNAKLTAVIDSRKKIRFCDIESTSKEWLKDCDKNTLCLVCAPAAMPEAREYFKELNYTNYLLCWSDDLPR